MSTKNNSQASAPDADPVAQLPGMFISSPAPKGSSRAATRSSTTAVTVQPTNAGTSSSASEVIDLAGSPEASNADHSKAENSAFLQPAANEGDVTEAASQTECRYVPGDPRKESSRVKKLSTELLRMVRQFAYYNPELLGEVEARQDLALPEYDFDRSPPMMPAPRSDWKPPPVPLVDDWSTSDEVVRNYEAQVTVFHLVNAAHTLVRQSEGKPIRWLGDQSDLPKVNLRDISIGLTDGTTRLVVECTEAPGKIVKCQEWNPQWDAYSEVGTENFDGDTHEARTRQYLDDFKDKEARRRDKHCQLVARLSTLRHRETLSDAERRLRSRGVTSDEITKLASWEGLAEENCDLHDLMQVAHKGIKTEHALRLAAEDELRAENVARDEVAAKAAELAVEVERLKRDLQTARVLPDTLRTALEDLRVIHSHTQRAGVRGKSRETPDSPA